MEERMTLCNMSIEAGARAGMVAPDDTTFEYLAEREYTPKGSAWVDTLEFWRKLPTDPGATFDREFSLDVTLFEPMITYGTNPGMGLPISHPIPDPQQEPDLARRAAMTRALEYMGLRPRTKPAGT
jgi:3-isopropylmalate/(R)-2-methylmalate dehydratase large subunit